MRKKFVLTSLMLMLGLFFVSAVSTMPVNAAAGATGALDIAVSSALEGNTLTIRVYDLTVSADYALVINAVAEVNWTTSATETSHLFYYEVEEYGSTGYMLVQLTGGAATALDTKYITLTDTDTLLPISFIIDIGIALAIIGVVVLVVKGIKGRMND